MGLLQPAAADEPVSHRGHDSPRVGAFTSQEGVDSLRAVEKCAQHPGKMWVVRGDRMLPLLPFGRSGEQPWHSTPYQALPPVYVQNASLEIAWTRVVFERRTIAGDVLVPFLTEGYEGFDINDPHDWMVAERLLADGDVPAADGCRRTLSRQRIGRLQTGLQPMGRTRRLRPWVTSDRPELVSYVPAVGVPPAAATPRLPAAARGARRSPRSRASTRST